WENLPRRAAILDLGCGCGVPDARLLAERFEVTGVDISDVQIARARAFVPRATFIRADMTRVAFPPGSFEGVICLYGIIHVPMRQQPGLLVRIGRWLKPGGLFLAISGHGAWTGREKHWLGSRATMYWSHPDPRTFARWLHAAGFDILRQRTIPEGASAHRLFLCRRRADASRPPPFRRRETAMEPDSTAGVLPANPKSPRGAGRTPSRRRLSAGRRARSRPAGGR
ncbi:MAG TPA: class I SAM-dependent methyltransferase, partial [Thermoplasmata archaeon]|nr:class I SAM-dependent methyltransferase [Thermoplasmata archaeon]